MSALVERADGTVVDLRHLRDDPAALTAALDDDVDVIAVTGSSSVGLHDHLHRALTRAGATWHIDGVRCRLGHPQSLARTWVVGLPSNPYAGLVAALTILEPVVAALSGRRIPPHRRLPVRGQIRPRPDDTVLLPVQITDGDAVVVAGARRRTCQQPPGPTPSP